MDPDWKPRDAPCPVCGAPTEVGEWWDDPPEMGGGHIGSLYRCTKCDWTDRT